MKKYDANFYKQFKSRPTAEQTAFSSVKVQLPELPRHSGRKASNAPVKSGARRLSELPELLTPLECAKYLRCSYETVLELIKEGKLRNANGGGWKKLIPVTELENFLYGSTG